VAQASSSNERSIEEPRWEGTSLGLAWRVAQDPLDPLDPSRLTPLTPFDLDAPIRPPSPSVPPAPPSLVPESVRQRAAFDLPFALDPGGMSAPVAGASGSERFDADTDGVPVGLPDFSALMGLAPEEPAPKQAHIWKTESLPPALEDDDLMALPSPSMIGPSPFAKEEEDDDDDEENEDRAPVDVDSFGEGLLPPAGHAVYSDDTQEEQLPPTPIHPERTLSFTAEAQVPARVLMEALAELQSRHMRNLVVAFLLGTASAVVGFVAARWALTAFGQ
jgi:hypothetical protein